MFLNTPLERARAYGRRLIGSAVCMLQVSNPSMYSTTRRYDLRSTTLMSESPARAGHWPKSGTGCARSQLRFFPNRRVAVRQVQCRMYKINFFAEPSARGSGRQEEDLPGYTPSFGATPPGGPPEAPGYARRKKAGVATSKYTRWGPRRNTVVVYS